MGFGEKVIFVVDVLFNGMMDVIKFEVVVE